MSNSKRANRNGEADDDAARAGAGGTGALGSSWLRPILVAGDALCIVVTLTVASLLDGWITDSQFGLRSVDRIVILSVIALALLRHKQLYRAARSSVVTLEVAALCHVGAGIFISSVALDQLAGVNVRWRLPIVQTALAVLFLIVWRSAYRAALRAARRGGRYLRPVTIVGVDEEAARLHRLLRDHDDTGFRCVGVVGDRDQAMANGLAASWRGPATEAVRMVENRQSTGIILVPTALSRSEANAIARAVQRAGGHVHLGSTLSSIDHRRISMQPIAHEPMLYVEPSGTGLTLRVNDAAKRAMDIAGALVGLLLASPFLAAAAVAIKVTSGGPILFRQQRVGRDGELFTMLKLRTMVEDAESMVVDLNHLNHREGPLFKIDEDPRITRVGRFLRATDLDEVPQLLNVLLGEMSLVGPRPALPHEVEQFDDELKRRSEVLPGLTGLWQVESRDNPSFDAYQRLDLFYVDNRSLTLDLVILLLTFESKLVQRLGVRPRRTASDVPEATVVHLEELPTSVAG